jgi:hypothetical protein
MIEYRHQELLDSDGWRPRSEYVPTKGEYVYVRGIGFDVWTRGVAIARGGKYSTSFWWDPDGNPLRIDVEEWKPFPNDGIPPHKRWHDFKTDPNDQRYVRPPEEVYEPAGTDALLKPVPRKLLLAMAGGAILHESAWRWTKWSLQMPCAEPAKTTEVRGGILKLRECAFIARNGTLPPGRLPRWFEFDWVVTDAGRAWIEANPQ